MRETYMQVVIEHLAQVVAGLGLDVCWVVPDQRGPLDDLLFAKRLLIAHRLHVAADAPLTLVVDDARMLLIEQLT